MNALVLIAEGFEEMEMVTIVDILRRGEISVTLATIEKNFLVLGRNGISILSEEKVVDIYEKVIDNQTFYDCIIVPGGMESVKRLSLVLLINHFSFLFRILMCLNCWQYKRNKKDTYAACALAF